MFQIDLEMSKDEIVNTIRTSNPNDKFRFLTDVDGAPRVRDEIDWKDDLGISAEVRAARKHGFLELTLLALLEARSSREGVTDLVDSGVDCRIAAAKDRVGCISILRRGDSAFFHADLVAVLVLLGDHVLEVLGRARTSQGVQASLGGLAVLGGILSGLCLRLRSRLRVVTARARRRWRCADPSGGPSMTLVAPWGPLPQADLQSSPASAVGTSSPLKCDQAESPCALWCLGLLSRWSWLIGWLRELGCGLL